MSLVDSINSLALGIGNYIRDSILTRVLPPGGTNGQVLAKNSGSDFDATWKTVSGAGGSSVVVSDLPPDGLGTDTLYIQTGLGEDGQGVTFWFEDGK